jgi:hypothetical protein
MDSLVSKLYKSKKTILTVKDLALIWQISNEESLYSKTSYYVKQKALIRLTRGVFAKDAHYDSKELATSLYVPCYISFETVLREAGVIFQHYDTIFVASSYAFSKKIDKYSFTFRKLKDSVLFSPVGIKNVGNYSVATTERAFLDMIYLFPNYYFDNLRPINWEKCEEILKIYHNIELTKRFNQYRKLHVK